MLIEDVCQPKQLKSPIGAHSAIRRQNQSSKRRDEQGWTRQVDRQHALRNIDIYDHYGGDCPQGGILCTLMWNLVTDALLRFLNRKGCQILGYADVSVILAQGKQNILLRGRMYQIHKPIQIDRSVIHEEDQTRGARTSKTSIITGLLNECYSFRVRLNRNRIV